MKADIISAAGKKLKSFDLEPSVFEVKENNSVVHQVVKAQMAGARSGTASTKGRAEVRGGGRKPWRQKGSGRARAGSIRSPLWKGGGVTFGPTPRDFSQKVPRKVRKLALRSILSAKARGNAIYVLDKFDLDKAATKQAKETLDKLKVDGRATVVVDDSDELAIKSLRNLPSARVIKASKINAYDLTDCASLVFTKEAIDKVTEVLSQ